MTPESEGMKRNISILGIPMDLGAGRRGTDMGPSAMRLARLGPALRKLGHSVTDLGNVDVQLAESSKNLDHGREDARFAEQIIAACTRAYSELISLEPGHLPLSMGGDHAVAMATVAAAVKGPAECDAVIWIDAHADLNTPESSPSGNVHGMPMAQLLGLGTLGGDVIWGGGAVLSPEQIVYIGLRNVDPFERSMIADLGIKAFSMTDIDRLGMARVIDEAFEHLGDFSRWHVSLDADALDPQIAPGVGTPVAGGLTFREAHLLMESLAAASKVESVDLVEVNPILDTRNHTAELVTGLGCSLLGKQIL